MPKATSASSQIHGRRRTNERRQPYEEESDQFESAPSASPSAPSTPAGPVMLLLSTLAVGGSETKAVRIVNALAREGRDVHLAYLDTNETLLGEIDNSVQTICLQRRGAVSAGALARLHGYVRDNDIRAILAMNLYPTLYSSAIAKLWPHAPVRNLMAINTTEHTTSKARRQMWLYAPLLRRADGVIFGCVAQMEKWTQAYNLHKAPRMVIYNGVDTTRFSPGAVPAGAGRLRERLGYLSGEVVIGTVGRLGREKSTGSLIEAIARVHREAPNVRGLLVGDGPERGALQQQIDAAGLNGRITILGEVQDVRPALQLMDVFVLPSASETFSNAALEAMAMARPVVLSDVGGAREMVSDQVTGCLFSKGDINALSAIVLHLVQDAAMRRTLGDNAREEAEKRFSHFRMIEDYKRLFDSQARPGLGTLEKP